MLWNRLFFSSSDILENQRSAIVVKLFHKTHPLPIIRCIRCKTGSIRKMRNHILPKHSRRKKQPWNTLTGTKGISGNMNSILLLAYLGKNTYKHSFLNLVKKIKPYGLSPTLVYSFIFKAESRKKYFDSVISGKVRFKCSTRSHDTTSPMFKYAVTSVFPVIDEKYMNPSSVFSFMDESPVCPLFLQSSFFD